MVYSHLLVLTASAGQSILFAIESNPGPGIGILLAYMIFGKGGKQRHMVQVSSTSSVVFMKFTSHMY